MFIFLFKGATFVRKIYLLNGVNSRAGLSMWIALMKYLTNLLSQRQKVSFAVVIESFLVFSGFYD